MIFSGQSGRDGGRVFWDTVLHEFPLHSETVSLLSFPLIVNGLVVGIAMCNALRFLIVRNPLESGIVPSPAFNSLAVSYYVSMLAGLMSSGRIIRSDQTSRSLMSMD